MWNCNIKFTQFSLLILQRRRLVKVHYKCLSFVIFAFISNTRIPKNET